MIYRQIVISEAVGQELRQLAQQCAQRGRQKEFNSAIMQFASGLAARLLPPAAEDDVFGCLQYHLPHLGLLICVAAVALIAVLFGTVETQPKMNSDPLPPVYVMRLRLMS
jgi:hypothetical protein